MSWKARVDSYNHVTSNDVVEVVTIYEQLDAQGRVLAALPKTWRFTSAESPNAADLSQMMQDDLAKTVRLRQNLLDYAQMQNTPIEMLDPPWPLFPISVGYVSKTDAAIQALKTALKPVLVIYVKTHPACEMPEILTAIEGQLGAQFRALVEVMTPIYVAGAAQVGLIESPDFDLFRDWLVATPAEQIMSL
jgi:hypothetical protein